MRTEVFVERLIENARFKETKPDALARLIVITMEKVANENTNGSAALKLARERIVREVLRDTLGKPNLRLRRTKAEMGKRDNPNLSLPAPPVKRGPGRPRKVVTA